MYHLVMAELKISDIRRILADADAQSFPAIERSLKADTRKGVVAALGAARRRLAREAEEAARMEDMYAFERRCLDEAQAEFAIGLDEVGRGPLAGPLTIGAVVLDLAHPIEGLNDSKQLSEARREELAAIIKDEAIAWDIVHVEPEFIDLNGMSASLRHAFTSAITHIEAKGIKIGLVLLDGNPMHLDDRELNIIKGDAKCPSIAAASIIAKVERDNLMKEEALRFPQYGFDIHKGYGTKVHRDAIREHGLCEIHRRSFCSEFNQQSLF